MNISIDKLKICYTLSEQSDLHDLMENPTEEFKHPEWGFRLEREEGLCDIYDSIRRRRTFGIGRYSTYPRWNIDYIILFE